MIRRIFALLGDATGAAAIGVTLYAALYLIAGFGG